MEADDNRPVRVNTKIQLTKCNNCQGLNWIAVRSGCLVYMDPHCDCPMELRLSNLDKEKLTG